MNISVNARTSLVVLAALGAGAFPFGNLNADDSLNSWKDQSTMLVNTNMTYPRMAVRL